MMEHLPAAFESSAEPPRASRLPLLHRPEMEVEIWMGGSQSLLGEDVSAASLAGSVVIDCTGDLPEPWRSHAGRYVARAFIDIETIPAAYPRIASLVHEIAEEVRAGAPDGPLRIYVLCQQGMNRSGLVTGLLLRALGEPPERALNLIREVRPGALSNHTFAELVHGWRCPEDAGG
jgi:hypothetical protein